MSDDRKYTVLKPQRLLSEGLLASAAKNPGKPALVVEGTPYSYGELAESALKLASALIARGLKRGDRVAIYMDNTWSCAVSIYAVLFAGGVFLVINPQTKAEKLEFVLNDSDAVFLLTDAHLEVFFANILQNVEKLQTVIASGVFKQEPTLAKPLEKFDEVIQSVTEPKDPAKVIANDLAALIYTSGSTGTPKGVMHTHQSMVFASWSLIEYLRLSENDSIILVLPLAFDYGLYQLLMAMNLGATLVVERSFTFPAQIYKRMEENKVSVFPGVPTIFAMMIASHKKKPLKFPFVTRITNTAAALPEEYVTSLHEIFPNALIYKMYGLTECKRVSYLEPELVDIKPNCVGKAIPGTEVYLQSADGEPVEPGKEGILFIRGPHVMVGYWKRPDLTEKMLSPGKLPGEKVLCSHDWFRMDDEGFLYFVGRSDDIIKTRGEKVSPVEVENVLHKISGINEAAVVGVEDDVFGQAVRAYVVLDKNSDLNDKKIKKECMAHMENFMVPKDVIILPEMPKTANGKVDKKYLVEMV